ncbi:calpain-5 [Diaporthe helianthi]|uniref:Calpain-5 n=1 Tax=Diaporthe helianthi TaxID=158607 RepID=A0A2P5HPI4_DIAHE|nr:calpain-5 [Diaporthe helianthi]
MDAGPRVPRAPQGEVNAFWSKFSRRQPSKVTSVFPRPPYASLLPTHPDPRGASSARNAAESYKMAARECGGKVRRIRDECERTNENITDPDFDIESDFVTRRGNCLVGMRHPPVKNEGRRRGRGRGRGSPSSSPSPHLLSPGAASEATIKAQGPGITGSVRCSEQNDTWLPLMEKAYAKAHVVYEAIDCGYVGDGIGILGGRGIPGAGWESGMGGGLSDGAEEWTPNWMEKLDHRFRNDGIFRMEYSDMLQTFGYIYRTRLFDER